MRKHLRAEWGMTLRAVLLLAGAVFALGCGGGSGGGGGTPPPPATPAISNINGATAPSAAAGQPIEINGSNFQAGGASVIFTQGGVTATATPSAGGTDSSIVVAVPSGSNSSQFTLPGNVTVTVQNSGGTSNGKTLAVSPAPTFSINTVAWTTTTPLPFSLTGLRAAAVPVSDSLAYIIVTGGFNGSTNTTTVYSNTLNSDGTVGPNWAAIPAGQLPAALAHHGMVEADASNSPVPTGSNFVYVIGGQQFSSESPGGNSTVFMAQVSETTGAVGTWTQLPNSLPETLVGPTVALDHGWIYVVGGLRSDGSPSPNVYSAQVNSDGSLGVWTTSGNQYPHGISFATAFGYGGNLFVLDGDTANSANPNALDSNSGTDSVYYARVIKGVVGPWTLNPTKTLESRKKHVTWSAFGQLINGEGTYGAAPGSLELEWSSVNSANTLNIWAGVINQINANVYNAAAVVSPLLSSAGTPRFLLLGGQKFVSSGFGQVTNQVYYNNAP